MQMPFSARLMSGLLLVTRPSRPSERDKHRAHAGEHCARAAAPPAGQPPGRRIPFPEAAAETRWPAAAGHWARAASAGDQEDRGHIAAPTTAGNLQRHVLRSRTKFMDKRRRWGEGSRARYKLERLKLPQWSTTLAVSGAAQLLRRRWRYFSIWSF